MNEPVPEVARASRHNLRDAILQAAETLFATNGFRATSIRDIAQAANTHPGSVSYHFKSKDSLLLAIYRRHCGPMNRRRAELLREALRIRDLPQRLEAIVRAYVLPAFVAGGDETGGGAGFTRLRAVMSAEGNTAVRQIIAETFDETSQSFIDAIHQSLPHLPRATIIWRAHFLLGALYYTLVTPERIDRLSHGAAHGGDAAVAVEQLVQATVAALQAPDIAGHTAGAHPPTTSNQEGGE
ncbi:MAG TPA: TetR family transcriptional regulator [Pseudolabrys sp.]|nr:TetR family transcriptional regulator [Pseudolabrys sp.]